ncbi:hypothetical protein FRB99_001746 [Tulasnella sp. 403]|nr:hypothetical protein FRB99_001746 [Tulasnella sp. 403]
MQFSRSGRYLLSETWEFNVLVWSLEDGKLTTTFSGHTRTIWGTDISSDDAFVASGGLDRTLRFWDLNETGHEPGLVSLPECVYAVAFAVDSPVVAAGIKEHGVWLIEVPTGSIVVKVDVASILLLRFSATGDWLVAGSWDGDLTCWSTADLLSDKTKTEQGVCVKERKMANSAQNSTFTLSAAISSDGVWVFVVHGNSDIYAVKDKFKTLVGTVPNTWARYLRMGWEHLPAIMSMRVIFFSTNTLPGTRRELLDFEPTGRIVL